MQVILHQFRICRFHNVNPKPIVGAGIFFKQWFGICINQDPNLFIKHTLVFSSRATWCFQIVNPEHILIGNVFKQFWRSLISYKDAIPFIFLDCIALCSPLGIVEVSDTCAKLIRPIVVACIPLQRWLSLALQINPGKTIM